MMKYLFLSLVATFHINGEEVEHEVFLAQSRFVKIKHVDGDSFYGEYELGGRIKVLKKTESVFSTSVDFLSRFEKGNFKEPEYDFGPPLSQRREFIVAGDPALLVVFELSKELPKKGFRCAISKLHPLYFQRDFYFPESYRVLVFEEDFLKLVDADFLKIMIELSAKDK